MAEDLNNKYQRKEMCDERMNRIEGMFKLVQDELAEIKQAVNPTRDLARNNKARLDIIEKSRERSWQSGWKLFAIIVGAFGGIEGLSRLIDILTKQ